MPLCSRAPDRVITLSSVRLLMANVELENVADGTSDFEAGPPLVVDVNLEGGPTFVAVGDIPEGTYDEFEFEVRGLVGSEGEDDPQFADFQVDERPSIIIEGTFQEGTVAPVPFTLLITAGFDQKLDLTPPLEVSLANAVSNLTLTIDVANWFNDPLGGLLDPTDAANLPQIEANITGSYEVFEDEDADGEQDFEDEVASVDVANNRFTLENGLVVDVSGAAFEGAIITLQEVADLLALGQEVEAEGEGTIQDSIFFASEVEFDVEEEDEEEDFEGIVASVDAGGGSFTLNGLVIQTNAATEFEGAALNLTELDVLLGQGVEVSAEGEGTVQTDGSILASEVEFKTSFGFQNLVDLIEANPPARLEIELISGTATAEEVALEDPEDLTDDEEIESTITAMNIDCDDLAASTITLSFGGGDGLVIGFSEGIEFEGSDGDLTCQEFTALVTVGTRVEVSRPAPAVPQALDAVSFVAEKIELEDDDESDDGDEEIEINVDADNLTVDATDPRNGTIQILGIDIVVNVADDVTEIDVEADD
ncbi:MAG: DUF5666 domain-containing protein [Candidatus Bipolaricaulia bacterium]